MNSTSPTAAPFARTPRPPRRDQEQPENRSSLLRASILESALELGIGSSRTVANWMFNPVDEVVEEEEETELSPSLTYASTATSEESNLSAGLAQRSQPGAGTLLSDKDTSLGLDTSVQYSKRNGLSPGGVTQDRTLQFDLRVTPEPRPISPAPSPQPSGKNKLRKTKPDGYESDGGYVSEGGKGKKEKKEKKSKKKGKEKEKDGEGDGGPTDYESDGGFLSEASVKKKKSTKEKKDKSKAKNVDSPTTDYETDKGYLSSFSRSKSQARKHTVTSPTSGDESDGGYLSESSKKKRFFRLNSKSRKKQDSSDSVQDQPPPVPALPFLPLPIHEKFSRANTPIGPDSRNVTPIPSDTGSSIRPSVDTFMSEDTTTSMDTSLTADTSSADSPTATADTTIALDVSSTTVESDEFGSGDDLTKAFLDAESVRSPSIDFLSTFRRHGALSPSRLNPFAHSDPAESPGSPVSPKSPVAVLSPSKSVRSRPKISSPNTTALSIAPRHVPVPLTLTPPTPTLSSYPGQPSPDPDYVVVTPNPSTPTPTSDGRSKNSPPSPTLQRPHVLAHYDLPPPSPPPRGPLPDVPSDISRSTSPSWSMMDSSPSRASRTAPPEHDPRGPQNRAMASPVDRSYQTAPHPLSREISVDVPNIAQPVPPALRGRMSPFPTAPVLPREQTALLVRQTSKLTSEAVARAHRNGTQAPTSASPYTNGHSRWPSQEPVSVPSGPMSARPYADRGESHWPSRDQLGVHWQQQPRSVSALGTRKPPSDDEGSWLVYDDDEQGDASDLSLSAPNTRPPSTEASPDVNAILAGFRAQRDAEIAARHARPPKPKSTAPRDTLAGIVADYERETMYLDVDENGGDRSSVWSEANSRHSFLDGEKSAEIRAKFVRRVEAMYGKDIVPPVPRLDQGLKSRGG